MNLLELAKAHNWNMPTKCPVCDADLEINTTGVVYCPNKECEQKVLHKIIKLTQVWNVLEIGPSIVKDFVEAENIKSIYDFLTKLKNPSLDEICGKNAEKIRHNFEKVMSAPITTSNFIAAFDLDGYGQKSIQSLVDAGLEWTDLLDVSCVSKVSSLKCWTEESAKELFNLIQESNEDILACSKLVTIQDNATPVNGKFSGLSFCFTGSNDYKPEEKRKLLETKVIELGGTIGSVKKGLSYLVSSETGTAKMVKAAKDGIPTITYEQFYKMLEA